MKKDFPIYAQYQSQAIKQGLSERNQEIIDKHLVFCGTTACETKLKDIERVMIKTCDVLECDLDKLNLDILREFLNVLKKSSFKPSTKNAYKKYLKRYIKENYDNWFKDFKELKDIKMEKEVNQDKINAQTIIRPNEIERIIKSTNNIMYKALIMLAHETAGRPSSLLNIKWRDVDFNKKQIRLKSTKTGNTRVLLVNETISHLKRYRDECYENPQAENYVFISNNRYKPITLTTFETNLKKLSMKALGKPVFPYLIRHSRLTEMQKKLTGKVYEKFADHSLQTATRYCHLDNNDVVEALSTHVYQIQELTEAEQEELSELKKEFKKHKKASDKEIDTLRKQMRVMIDKVGKLQGGGYVEIPDV